MTFCKPLSGRLEKLRKLEYQLQTFLWEQIRADIISVGGSAEAVADRAYLAEVAWTAVAVRLERTAGAAAASDLAQEEIMGAAALAVETGFEDEELESVIGSVSDLRRYALYRLNEAGAVATPEAVAAAMLDIASVRSVAAGMTRHQYCAHIAHKPASAMMVLLLDPAISPEFYLDENLGQLLQALLPPPAANEVRETGTGMMAAPAALPAERVSSLRPRIWHHREGTASEKSRRGRLSRHAAMTVREALAEMLADSPHMRQLAFEGPKQGVSWAKLTRAHFDATMKLVLKVFGNMLLADLRTEHWCAFFAMLDRLPTNHHKSKFDAHRTLEEICERGAAQVAAGILSPEKIGLGAASINRHVSSLRTLYTWFQRHVEVPYIPWARFCRPLPRATRERGYTREEVAQIIKLPPYTGRATPTGPLIPGHTIWHNAAYWVFLLLIYSGARLGEVCGLLTSDIKCSHGIWYMSLVSNEDRSLKRSASTRDVPLHPELIRLGFLKFIEALQGEGETMVFPELRSDNGRSLASGFEELNGVFFRKLLPFMGGGRTAHPIRHLVNDLLKLSNVALEDREFLLGHEGKVSQKRVASVLSLKRLQKVVEQIPSFSDQLEPAPILLHPRHRRIRRTR